MNGAPSNSNIAPGGVFVNTSLRLRQNRARTGLNPLPFQIFHGNFITFFKRTNDLPPFTRALAVVWDTVQAAMRGDGSTLLVVGFTEVRTMRRERKKGSPVAKITVRIEEDRHRELKELSERMGLPRSAIVNLAIKRFVRTEEGRW